jgi:CubicO group peptidase (beta-lactamase class C family)
VEAGKKLTDLHEFMSAFQAEPAAQIDGLEGAPFEYVSVNTDLMGWIVERAAGKKFAELVSEYIWQPMGAESDALITVDRLGNARTAGGMCATVRDIARMGQLMLEDDNGVVPADWIHDMLRNGSKDAFAAGAWKRGFERYFKTAAYRSYWITDSDTEVLMGLGIHGQMLFADRKNKIVMAKTSSQPDRIDFQKTGMHMGAFKEIQRILS